MNYIIPKNGKEQRVREGEKATIQKTKKKQQQAKQKANVMYYLYTFRINDNKNFVTICAQYRLYIFLYIFSFSMVFFSFRIIPLIAYNLSVTAIINIHSTRHKHI